LELPALEPAQFAEQVGAWLGVDGPEADVVVSCRARLARNLAGHSFVERLEDDEAVTLRDEMQAALAQVAVGTETRWVDMEAATPLVRLLLQERHLVSRDLAPVDSARPTRPGRAVAFGVEETTSVMVNEEDHVRIQGLSGGFQLGAAWASARDLDVALEDHLKFATDPRLGYLTGCPTNVGTGLRASVMLHLPGLGQARTELEKVFTAAQRTGLAVRGMYGEGSRAAGDFYQISNQVTLGRTEQELVTDLEALVPCIVEFERRVRAALIEGHPRVLEERVQSSQEMLRTALSLPTETALMHLSNVRLGACLGLDVSLQQDAIGRIAIQVQRGHVQALAGEPVTDDLAEPTERDRLRASWLRRRFAASG
jgi:protein arginine kinase